MRRLHLFSILSCCLFVLGSLSAQENRNQAFWVHEDQVRPGMVSEYEDLSKELVDAAKKSKLQNMRWAVAAMDNGNYLSITPIKNMADLESKSFQPLMDSMGEDKFNGMMSRFNDMYDKHGDYIIVLDNDLSYMPEGLVTSTPGKDYRKWHKMSVNAENVSQLRDKLVELKNVFDQKGSKMYYRIYRSGFGNMGAYFVAVISAKDATDYAQMSAENEKLLGEEGKQKFREVMDLVSAYDVSEGGMRPDLAYAPEATPVEEMPANDDD
ncbi:MAG: hypothetical protein WBL21_09715 [Salinimicrobium sp.]